MASLAFVAVVLAASGFLPLFGGPTYEAALLAGLLVPLPVALGVALGARTRRASDAVMLGLGRGLAAALVVLALATLHGARAGFCDARGGYVLLALGPCMGALMAGAWGAVAGLAAGPRRSARWAALVAALGPLGGVAVSLGRFYSSPMIFAYDPFVGFFSGTLYDTVIDPAGLVSYRVGSLASLLALVALAPAVRRDGARLRARPARLGATRLGLGLTALVVSLGVTVEGARLGHWQTTSTIRAALGGTMTGERCEVVYARTLERRGVELFLAECDAHVEAGARFFGVEPPARVVAFLFEDEAQKGALMGASDTYIAKPWRGEVYLQAQGFPHPVLGHEIAHVLAAAFGRGPLRIAGKLGGLVPDPGLIEGVAVAASPHEGTLSPSEWARAMRELGLLPPLRTLFGLGFLGQASSTAYTVSGAFVGWVRETYGAPVVRAWYGGASLEALTHEPWPALEAAWHRHLDTIPLAEAALAQAKARFGRKGMFARRCPHEVDACRERGAALAERGDLAGALAEYERARALDADPSLALRVAEAHVRAGLATRGRELYLALADDGALRADLRDRAREALADLALAEGRLDEARERYRDVASRTIDEDALRTLDVKLVACDSDLAREAVRELLMGAPGRGADRQRAAELLGVWSERAPRDGLPHYLRARAHVSAGQWELAYARLVTASGLELPNVRVRRETARLGLVAACALGRPAEARRFFEAFAREQPPRAREEAARELTLRCERSPPRRSAPE